jgi:hypothetical protein
LQFAVAVQQLFQYFVGETTLRKTISVLLITASIPLAGLTSADAGDRARSLPASLVILLLEHF